MLDDWIYKCCAMSAGWGGGVRRREYSLGVSEENRNGREGWEKVWMRKQALSGRGEKRR